MNKTFFRIRFAGGSFSDQDFNDLSEARKKLQDLRETTGEYAENWKSVARHATLYEVNQTLTEISHTQEN